MIIVGLGIAFVGVLALLLDRYTGFRLGHLPLDISIQRENFSFYFPLGTCILLSVVFSFIIWLFGGWR